MIAQALNTCVCFSFSSLLCVIVIIVTMHSQQTHTHDFWPTFHHSSLESSVTCTRSPGLKQIRHEKRWAGGGMKGAWLTETKWDAWRQDEEVKDWHSKEKSFECKHKDDIIKLSQTAVVTTMTKLWLKSGWAFWVAVRRRWWTKVVTSAGTTSVKRPLVLRDSTWAVADLACMLMTLRAFWWDF